MGGTQDFEVVGFYLNIGDMKCKKKHSQHRDEAVLFISVFPRFPTGSEIRGVDF